MWRFRFRNKRQSLLLLLGSGIVVVVLLKSWVAYKQVSEAPSILPSDEMFLTGAPLALPQEGRDLSAASSSASPSKSGPSGLTLSSEKRASETGSLQAKETTRYAPASFEADRQRDLEYLRVPFPDFRPTLLFRERRLLRELLGRLVEELQQGGITYMLSSGSLLGSLRHHGPVPWDDDVDILVPLLQHEQVQQRLTILKPRLFLNVVSKVRWTFYSANSLVIEGVSWRWPFIGIGFYVENSTHVWNYDPTLPHDVHPRQRIFPLAQRPFMDWLLPVPRRSDLVVASVYRLDVCSLHPRTHRNEAAGHREERSLDCRVLMGYFPFVTRTQTPSGVNETLRHRNQILGWFWTRF